MTVKPIKWCPLTSDSTEGVEVLSCEQGSRQFPDELFEQRSSVVWTHLVPADLPWVEVGLQVLLQQLETENNETFSKLHDQRQTVSIKYTASNNQFNIFQ